MVLRHHLLYGDGGMTLISLQDGKPVMRDGKIGTEQACCCGGGNKRCAKCYPPPYLCDPLQFGCYKNGSLLPQAVVDCADCYAQGGEYCDWNYALGSYLVNDCSECEGGLVDPWANNNARGDCHKYCSYFDVTSCAECLSLNDNAEMTASLADGTPGPWVYECDEPQVFP